MNATRWVVAASALIALAAVLLVRWLEVEDPAPAPPPPPAPVASAPAPTRAPFVAAGLETDVARPPVEVDAGFDAGPTTRDVRFHVLRKGQTAVGERLVLQCRDVGRDAGARSKVSGLVDQMGDVTLPIPRGGCDVSSPERVEPSWVSGTVPEQTLEILEPLVIAGRLVDANGRPAKGLVTVGSPPHAFTAPTDDEGRFARAVDSTDRVKVVGESGTQSTEPHFVAPPTRDLLLVLEPTYSVDIRSLPANARAVATSRWGTSWCWTPCTVAVPAGELRVTAMAAVRLRLLSATTVEPITGPARVDLMLAAIKPLRGEVKTVSGVPVRGLPVSVRAIAPSNDDLLDGERPLATTVELTSVVTDVEGRFALAWPPLTNSLFYVLEVAEPRKLVHRALVSPGDAQVELLVAD